MAIKFWPKIGKKSYKNGHKFSCVRVRHINAEFGFEIANSTVTLPEKRDKGALPWQPTFGLKLP